MTSARIACAFFSLALLACQKQPASLVIEPNKFLPLERKGKTVQLKAQTKDDRNIFIATVQPEWSSSDPSVATVGPDGLVTAQGTGKTVITGKTQGVEGSVEVDVRIVGAVEVEPKEPQKLKLGKTMKFKAVVKDDRGNVMPNEKILWRAAGYAIDVDQDGLVTAQALGESTLVAQAKDKETRVPFVVVD
ncbi:MAG: Ig-like domain-containing protein [Myxococcota bacterium]